MARKTISIEALRAWVNTFNLNTRDDTSDVAKAKREGQNALLEVVLQESNAYKGFRYLDDAEAVRSGSYDESARHYH